MSNTPAKPPPAEPPAPDPIDEAGRESFPASDPPSWAAHPKTPDATRPKPKAD